MTTLFPVIVILYLTIGSLYLTRWYYIAQSDFVTHKYSI